jgi:hypothetical protein
MGWPFVGLGDWNTLPWSSQASLDAQRVVVHIPVNQVLAGMGGQRVVGGGGNALNVEIAFENSLGLWKETIWTLKCGQ